MQAYNAADLGYLDWAADVSCVPQAYVLIIATCDQAVLLLRATGNATHSCTMALPAASK